MKRKNFLQMGVLMMIPALSLSSCEDETNGEVNQSESSEIYGETIENYVYDIVIPTYAEMKENAFTLLEKVEEFAQGGTDAQLEAACDAWRNTREPWEESEAFLFGPAATYGLDPLIDSWPLDKTNIESYLNSSISLDVDNVRESLGATVRGFHTLEYLLFKDGKARTAADITDRQKEYMVAVATVLRDDCLQLWYYWNGQNNVSEKEQTILEELEVETSANGFAERFCNPNMFDQLYKTQVDVIWQIVDGCTDICGEVGEQKIGGPYETQNVEEVESWYSWNSLADYENNVISIQHSYLGNMSDDITLLDNIGNENSISAIVAKNNSDLDEEIRKAIKEARNAVDAIPQPFRNNLTASSEIEFAMERLNDLNDILGKIKTIIK